MVHWITDGGTYSDDDKGVLLSIGHKVHTLPGGVALAWRGHGGDWVNILAAALHPLGTFDRMVVALPGILYALTVGEPEDPPEGGWVMEVHVAGWSVQSGQVVAMWISTHDTPFMMQLEPGVSIAPAPKESLEEILGYDLVTLPTEMFNAPVDGLKLIEAQRRYPQRGGFGVAGGFAELTTIDQFGVSRHILTTWPDVIGEPIDIPEEYRVKAEA